MSTSMLGTTANDDAHPASWGFQAHTPDPDTYHKRGGGTVLPHVRSNASLKSTFGGASPAFNVNEQRAGFVDPVNHYTGEGAVDIVQPPSEKQAKAKVQPMPDTPQFADHAGGELGPSPNALFEQTVLAPVPQYPYGQHPGGAAPPAPPVPPQTELTELMRQFIQAAQPVKQVAPPDEKPGPPSAEDLLKAIRLPYLGVEVKPPTVTVMFEVPGGLQRSKYHDVIMRGRWLTLVIDNRYDGDLFIPQGSQLIKIIVPDRKIEVEVCSAELNQELGVLTLFNFVIPAEPEAEEEDLDDE